MYGSGFDSTPFGAEWMRFEEDSPLPELGKKVPHVAFIVCEGAPVEFLEIRGGD